MSKSLLNSGVGLVVDFGKVLIFLMFVVVAFLVGLMILLAIWGLFL